MHFRQIYEVYSKFLKNIDTQGLIKTFTNKIVTS